MTKRNETLKVNYRFLSVDDFHTVQQTLLQAYSDYFVPFQLSEAQFENHITQNAVDLKLSVGAFIDSEMVAFTLNGFGIWNGKKTAYDAGTGVIPSYRSKGIGSQMFEFMIPKLKEIGYEQILLEVISHNEKAVRLYRKLGFEETRKLISCDRKKPDSFTPKAQNGIKIREMKTLDWNLLKTFWDGTTSWQYSAESIERSLVKKIIFGAYAGEKCVGFGIVSPRKGFIWQIAVDRNYRRKGIASSILAEMERKIGDDKKLRVSNVDLNLNGTIAFLQKTGFEETLSQFEMIKFL